jgi:DNA transposition AAA+ family ATPase
MKLNETKVWQMPDMTQPFAPGPGRSAEDFDTYRELLGQVIEIAENNDWSKSETARQIGIAEGTFSQWASMKYSGRYDTQNVIVGNFLDNYVADTRLAASIPDAPSFIKTGFSQAVTDMLAAAQLMPGMVMVTSPAGNGKTFTAERYRATHANVFMATMSESSRSVQAMLTEIAAELNVGSGGAGSVRGIGRRIARSGGGTLLIIDEAQHLLDEAVNQVRHFLDRYKCGIALLGNTETYSRFSNRWSETEKYGQLQRRIFMRMKPKPLAEADVRLFIRAWGVKDGEQENFLFGVARKPGALGQVNQTVKLAKMLALGAGREMSLKDLKSAWENRGVEV